MKDCLGPPKVLTYSASCSDRLPSEFPPPYLKKLTMNAISKEDILDWERPRISKRLNIKFIVAECGELCVNYLLNN